jgi:F-type H+-transporting ATPase subunit a
MVRWILIAAIVGVPIVLCLLFVPSHDTGNVFTTLFMHLIPAPLVAGAHDAHGVHHPLLAFAVPVLPAVFDMDQTAAGVQLVVTNLQLFQLAAVLLILVGFSGVPAHLRQGGGDAVTRVLTGFVSWVRDEMVFPSMGKERGTKFLPFFLALFFFILFMNLLGLVPGAATATASVWVTAALASITLFAMLVCGMIVQGPFAFWKNLVPHVPLALWPLMFFIELVGLVIKPFALTIRLFANMNGGHMVVLSFMGLMFYFAQMNGQVVGWATSPLAIGFAVFIMIIESFVAVLQAFIFTQLSILFIQTSVHPEH